MRARAPRMLRALVALLLAPALLVSGVVGAQAGKPPSKDRSATVDISRVTCTPTEVTYSVSSTRTTVDVEVRWGYSSGTIIQLSSTYVVQPKRSVPTNTSLVATAPKGYTVTSVTIVPVKKNGRSDGVSDYARIACS